MRFLSKRWPATLLLLLAVGAPLTRAADPGPATQPDPAADRLTFLTLQLSSIEASLHAVNIALRGAGYKAVLTSEKADEAAKGNELMDRNGGAPIAWDKFYGATAKQFEPRDIYGVPHPYQRPSQFDYLYHANNDQVAKANAEVASLSQKIDVLLARRRQLDAEQSALWATISWESLQNRDIPLNPLYRFLLKAKTSTAATDARCDLLRPAILFLRTIDQTVADDLDSLSTNQEATFTDLATRTRSAYTAAKEPFANAMLSADLDATDLKTAKDLLTSLKHLAELSKNITEAYRLALDGDAANDDNRKLTFRAQLQFALLDYATAAGDLDDRLIKLASAWDLESEKGVVNSDLIPKSTPKISSGNVLSSNSSPTAPTVPPPNATYPSEGKHINLLSIVDPSKNGIAGNWSITNGNLLCQASRDAHIEFPIVPPSEYDYKINFTRTKGSGNICFICSGGGSPFLWGIASYGNTRYGFVFTDGKYLPQRGQDLIVNNQDYTCIIKVRKNGAEVYLNNILMSSSSKNFSDLTTDVRCKQPDPGTIGVVTNGSALTIRSAEIVDISGESKILR